MPKPFDQGPRISSAKKVFAYGFSLRKQSIVKRFVQRDDVVFIENTKRVTPQSILLLWGRAEAPKPLPDDVHIVRLEDGFIRSVGLGADLVQPISWVLDTRGIYFDATQSSDLEVLLQTYPFDESLLRRAESFRNKLITSGITKYNVGQGSWSPPENSNPIILVPGQVETDASIQFGAQVIRRNIDLLKAVRQANPNVYIVYKPHPDVVAGLRGQGEGETEARQYCDEVVVEIGMADMLTSVDEVHTMTSLTGFEALLRGKRVVCHGTPFYAGWGLTEDHQKTPRRTRQLSLDALVAGALLLYPLYISRASGQPISAEQAFEELEQWRQSTGRKGFWHTMFQGVARRFLRRP